MNRQRRLCVTLVELFVLFVGSAYVPLGVWATNHVTIRHEERLVFLVLLLLTPALVAFLVLCRLGVRRTTALVACFVGILVIGSSGRIVTGLGYEMAALFLSVASVGVVVLVSRIRDHQFLKIGMIAIGVFLATGPMLGWLQATRVAGVSNISETPDLQVTLAQSPDVWLVVLDGYAGTDSYRGQTVLNRPKILEELDQEGFLTFASSWAAYPATTDSIPSLLDMGYPIANGTRLNPATIRDLYDSIGGENQAKKIMSRNGYETTMVEAGWSGSFCESYDNCVRSPLLDEAVFRVVERSFFGLWLVRHKGYAFSDGALNTMAWAIDNSAVIAGNAVPDFVFLHVTIPHPPFFVNAACDVEVTEEDSGVTFLSPPVDRSIRVAGYEAQTGCVDSFMRELAGRLDPGDVVIFVADHGTDSRNQLLKSQDEWQTAEVVERMNVLLAIRAGDSCEIGEPIVMPNVLRRVLSCISEEPIPILDDKLHIHDPMGTPGNPVVLRIGQEEVDRILFNAIDE